MKDSLGTVFVGLSGGVDSSVAAYLLQKEGYDVVGVFIKTWYPEWLSCTWREERRSAMRVAAVLEIPFLTVDFAEAYKKEVADYFIKEYEKGRTPNPDVMCNRAVKFGAFYEWARAQGADYVATGHYAKKEDGLLKIPSDTVKDQTYFLWTISPEVLSHTLFPLGDLEKKEVRTVAAEAGLPTATKKDSQGICFLGQVDMKEFLSHYIDFVPGDVLDENGAVIGRHEGAILYTLGQRHGFTITHHDASIAPLFVVSKDVAKNTITVAQTITHEAHKEVTLEEVNWNQGTPPAVGTQFMCRTRYRQEMISCEFKDDKTVVLHEVRELPTSGQSLVVYDGEVCLGGGVIS